MSATPQMPKLTIRTPITTVIIVLPIQLDEALRIPRSIGIHSCLSGRGPAGAGGSNRMGPSPDRDAHHKVAEAPSQPAAHGRIEAVPVEGHNRELWWRCRFTQQ